LAETGSLYRTLESQFGIRPARARQTIAARLPTEHECRVLGIARSVPVLALERTTHGDDGRPFEVVRSAYRGDVYRMALDLRSAWRVPPRGRQRLPRAPAPPPGGAARARPVGRGLGAAPGEPLPAPGEALARAAGVTPSRPLPPARRLRGRRA